MEDRFSASSNLESVEVLFRALRWFVVILGIWVVVVSLFEIRYLKNYFRLEVRERLPAWVQVDRGLGKKIAVEYMYMTDSPTGEIIIIGR